ncbi:MAG: leucine-rich repeat domain-containing protein, partial [Lachnospiraceae bacterium]|nr:leucine-rich repeat domain-containing protein [Lachnospiraceae bacterium]
QQAFGGCSKLTDINLPKSLKELESWAFADCVSLTSVMIPKALEEAGYSSFKNCDALKNVFFEEGIKTIPGFLFEECTGIEEIELPDTVETIGARAFSKCTNLKRVSMPACATTIYQSAFEKCPSLEMLTVPTRATLTPSYFLMDNDKKIDSENVTILCDYHSKHVVECIDKGFLFQSSGEAFEDSYYQLIDGAHSRFSLQTDKDGNKKVLHFSAAYQLRKEKQGKVTEQTVTIYVPKGTQLLGDSVKIDGVAAKDFSYVAESRRLRVTVLSDCAEVTFDAERADPDQYQLQSYAFVTARDEDGRRILQDTIDAINELQPEYELFLPELTDSPVLTISGNMVPGEEVKLYVDGKYKDSATATESGFFEKEITLSEDLQPATYYIEARTQEKGGTGVTVYGKTTCVEKAPKLSSFDLVIKNNEKEETFDLLALQKEGKRASFQPTGDYAFRIGFTGGDHPEKVYVTSRSGGVTKMLEAFWNESSGLYITKGPFAEGLSGYMPGRLGISYIMGTEECVVSDAYSFDELWPKKNETSGYETYFELINPSGQNAKIKVFLDGIIKKTPNAEATVMLMDVPVNGKASVDTWVKYAGYGNQPYSTVLKGAYQKEYLFTYVGDSKGSSVFALCDQNGDTDSALIMSLFMPPTVSEEMDEWIPAEQTNGHIFRTAQDYCNLKGILNDRGLLKEEICQSETVRRKVEALQMAKVLQEEKKAFLIATQALPGIMTKGD